MQNLMTELQQLYLRHDEITEDWEKLGFKIIEHELLDEMVKKLTEKMIQALLGGVFFVKFPTEYGKGINQQITSIYLQCK